MDETENNEAGEAEGAPEEGALGSEAGSPDLDYILEIPLELSVELGKKNMLINDLLQLSQGSVVELDKLASLPRILLATDLTDGTQFTIGCYSSSPSKRHSHSTVVNQSSYVRNLDGSQSRAVLVLSNLDLDYTQLTAELQHKDSQLIETAIMQSCKINSLPPLQLN